jgi:hypothetical protein
MQSEGIAAFTSSERDYIRRQLDRFFSTLPTVAEGFQLKTWRGGPEAGKPKLPPTAKGLVERGLMRLDAEEHLPRLFFTETGLAMLRAMMAERRFADQKNRPCSPRARHRPCLAGGPAQGMMTPRGTRALRTDRKPGAAWPPDARGTDITTPFAAVLWRTVLPCRRRDTRVLVRNLKLLQQNWTLETIELFCCISLMQKRAPG